DQATIRLTPDAINQTLRRASERHWLNALTPWPDGQSLAVAQRITTKWRGEPDKAHRFADWVVATWSEIEQHFPAPEYPDADFIDRNGGLLVEQFAAQFKQDAPKSTRD
ncbi:hypothetical protein, partial [Mesorhizobium sp. M4B.F.Ca.ET.089.01.1.1]|uniref:hypothetical protein n=1 Tax=Mesorhizobium sp. M4B.F.Ca.ET.089.01.1.1 TaxID=2496662 RepID=UPI001AED0615